MLIRIKKISKWFQEGNIIVAGERGKGKDVLFGNVIARIKRPYISNVDYTNDDRYIPLNYQALNVNNTWRNFISGKINYYKFPYSDGTNVYISDMGIHMPSQYNNELDSECGELAVYAALSRHLSHGHVHGNTQYPERPWNKMREQAENKFITCTRCIVWHGWVFAQFRLYDKRESWIANIPVFPYKAPIFKKKSDKINIDLEKTKYTIQYGNIKNYTYVCRNKSKHDTRSYKQLLENGDKTLKFNDDYFDKNGVLKPPKKKVKRGDKNEKDIGQGQKLPF